MIAIIVIDPSQHKLTRYASSSNRDSHCQSAVPPALVPSGKSLERFRLQAPGCVWFLEGTCWFGRRRAAGRQCESRFSPHRIGHHVPRFELQAESGLGELRLQSHCTLQQCHESAQTRRCHRAMRMAHPAVAERLVELLHDPCLALLPLSALFVPAFLVASARVLRRSRSRRGRVRRSAHVQA